MESLGRGRTAEVFLTEDGKALKLFFPEFQTEAPHREERIARIVSEQCPVAPAFYGTTTIDNRVGLVYERIAGEAVSETSVSDSFTIDDFSRQFARLHREIHTASGDGLRPLPDLIEKKIDAFDPISDGGKSLLLSHLHRDGPRQLCHGDFHPENVILSPQQHLRLSDVARTAYLIKHGLRPGLRAVAEEERQLREQVILGYCDEYFGDNPSEKTEWAAWQIIIMINRYTEIDDEKPTIEKAIAEIQVDHPKLR